MKSVLEKFWVDIKGFEGIYKVSRNGDVKRLRDNKIIKPYVGKNGYYATRLVYGGNKLKNIHRLVAEAFIPNPENKEFVDHINTVRTDNRVENLRWATRLENNNNPITKQKISTSKKNTGCKKVVQLTKEGECVAIHNSLKEAAEKYGVNYTSILNVCKGRKKSVRGYKWQYLSDYEKTH